MAGSETSTIKGTDRQHGAQTETVGDQTAATARASSQSSVWRKETDKEPDDPGTTPGIGKTEKSKDADLRKKRLQIWKLGLPV